MAREGWLFDRRSAQLIKQLFDEWSRRFRTQPTKRIRPIFRGGGGTPFIWARLTGKHELILGNARYSWQEIEWNNDGGYHDKPNGRHGDYAYECNFSNANLHTCRKNVVQLWRGRPANEESSSSRESQSCSVSSSSGSSMFGESSGQVCDQSMYIFNHGLTHPSEDNHREEI